MLSDAEFRDMQRVANETNRLVKEQSATLERHGVKLEDHGEKLNDLDEVVRGNERQGIEGLIPLSRKFNEMYADLMFYKRFTKVMVGVVTSQAFLMIIGFIVTIYFGSG